MIEIFKMPKDRKRFYAINDCVKLRRYAQKCEKFRIGFGEKASFELDEFDRNESYHILSYSSYRLIGYGRLRPMPDTRPDCAISRQVDELSRMMNRQPAFELQRVSVDVHSCASSVQNAHQADQGTLREIITQAFRICNLNGARFLFCSSDRGGMEHLRGLGLRYSTLTTPFDLEGAQLVILSIAVNNSNFASLNPFQLVGGLDATKNGIHFPNAGGSSVRESTVFEKSDALRETLFPDDSPAS